jgi:hypoxanthine phosphoribosyltransferase
MKIRFTWEEVNKYTLQLGNKIKKSKYKIDTIIGISRGGLIPAAHLGYQLEIQNVSSIGAFSYLGSQRTKLNLYSLPTVDLKNKNVLLVDEFADSGKTLEEIKDIIKKKYKVKQIKIATIFVNETACRFYPDFYTKKIKKNPEDWVLFPWDKK